MNTSVEYVRDNGDTVTATRPPDFTDDMWAVTVRIDPGLAA